MVLFDLGYLMQIYQEDSEDSYLQQDVTGDFIYYFAGKLVIDAVIGFDLYCSYYRSRMNQNVNLADEYSFKNRVQR